MDIKNLFYQDLNTFYQDAKEVVLATGVGMAIAQNVNPRGMLIALTTQKIVTKCTFEGIKQLESKGSEKNSKFYQAASFVGGFFAGREVSRLSGFETSTVALISAIALKPLAEIPLAIGSQLYKACFEENIDLSNTSILELSEETFSEEVLNHKGPVVLYAYSTQSSICKLLSSTIGELNTETKDSVKFVKVDVDKNPELAKKLELQSESNCPFYLPTVVFYKDGKRGDVYTGFPGKETLVKGIKKSFQI